MTTPLPTSRLHFNLWHEDDVALATQLWGDAEVTRYIGGPFSAAWIAERLATEAANHREHGVQYWPIFTADGTLVGCAGLRPYDEERRIYEVGAHLRPAFWGGGYACEALGAVIDYAFDTIHASALFAGHHPENQCSRKVVAKLGFVDNGTQLYIPTGLQHPTYLLHNPRG